LEVGTSGVLGRLPTRALVVVLIWAVGAPRVQLARDTAPTFQGYISLGLHSNIATVQYRNRTVRDIQYNSVECTVQTRKWAIAQALPHVLYCTTQPEAERESRQEHACDCSAVTVTYDSALVLSSHLSTCAPIVHQYLGLRYLMLGPNWACAGNPCALGA
jgi:hypothetical protein